MGHNLWVRALGFLNGTGQAADVRSLLTDAGCPDAGAARVFGRFMDDTSCFVLSVFLEMENGHVPLLSYRL